MKIGEIEFAELRVKFYLIIHSKRTLDELLYLWDFFKEHEVVTHNLIEKQFLEIKKGSR